MLCIHTKPVPESVIKKGLLHQKTCSLIRCRVSCQSKYPVPNTSWHPFGNNCFSRVKGYFDHLNIMANDFVINLMAMHTVFPALVMVARLLF